MEEVTKIAMATPGVDKVVALSGMSVLDSNSMLANGGVAYVILKDWGVRLKEPNQDLRSIVMHIGQQLRTLQDGRGFPLVPPNNVRWDYQLAGGALMDAGCYTIHLLRTLAGAEPEVSSATAKTRRAAVDRRARVR